MSDAGTGSPSGIRDALKHSFMTKAETVDLLANHQADPDLRADLEELTGDTTDDLGPIR